MFFCTTCVIAEKMEVYGDSSPLTSKKHVYCGPFTVRNNAAYGDEYYITMSTLNPSYTDDWAGFLIVPSCVVMLDVNTYHANTP